SGVRTGQGDASGGDDQRPANGRRSSVVGDGQRESRWRDEVDRPVVQAGSSRAGGQRRRAAHLESRASTGRRAGDSKADVQDASDSASHVWKRRVGVSGGGNN